MRSVFIVAGLAALAAPAAAQQGLPPAREFLASLAGRWEGALQYRDYQNNKLYEIPVKTTVSVTPDRGTVIQLSDFTDPGRQVYVVSTAITDDRGTREIATFRAGRGMSTSKQSVRVQRAEGPEDWTIIVEETGEDDNKPANIRETWTRKGAELTTLKEVDFLADPAVRWEYRNGTRATRMGD